MLWNIFFVIFGIGTCAYHAVETIGTVYDIPFLLCLFAPLLLIPISNSLILITRAGVGAKPEALGLMASLQAMAVGLSFLLLVVLSPLVLLACIGILMSVTEPRIGATALFYICVAVGPFITSYKLYSRLLKSVPVGTRRPGFGRATGLAVAILVILCALFPTSLTLACQRAAQHSAVTPRALLLLRAIGDDKTMLRTCYSESFSLPWYFNMLGDMFNRSGDGDDSKYQLAREIFYRVKGRAFNSYARPHTDEFRDNYYSTGNGIYMGYYTGNDNDFAGDTVGGIVRGLTLDQSQITGWVDADEANSHMVWKMHFHNNDSRTSELRGQILLPPHAVVEGCALYINGVKHDAVFNERHVSRQQYVQSAVQGDRPLLMSTIGASRVLLQSSMGTWGKDATLEVEIASPLVLTDTTKAVLPLPVFCERNFAIGTNHVIDLRSSTAMEVGGALTCQVEQGATPKQYHITGRYQNGDITTSLGTISFARNPSITGVQCYIPGSQPQPVRENFISFRPPATIPTVLVVDGSQGMASSIDTICRVLDQSHLTDASLVWASDNPTTLASHVGGSSLDFHRAVERLRDSSCLGGQDNGSALAQAVAGVGSKGQSVNVVWLHGAQPVDFKGTELLTLIQKSKVPVKLFEYQIEPGPNVVIKSLDQLSSFEQVPRINGLEGDLKSILAQLAGEKDTFVIERYPGFQPGLPLSRHTEEFSHLYISDKLLAALGNKQLQSDYGKLAQLHHLVTPLTSALVLETKNTEIPYSSPTTNSAQVQVSSSGPMAMCNSAGPGFLFGDTIATRPEPPMSLLMAIVVLIMAPVLWLTCRKKKFA